MCFTDDDYERTACFTTEVRRAAKDHDCSECAGPIPKGAFYTAASWVTVGYGWSKLKVCARCVFARELIVQAELADGCHPHEAHPPWGTLAESWREGQYAERLKLDGLVFAQRPAAWGGGRARLPSQGGELWELPRF